MLTGSPGPYKQLFCVDGLLVQQHSSAVHSLRVGFLPKGLPVFFLPDALVLPDSNSETECFRSDRKLWLVGVVWMYLFSFLLLLSGFEFSL